MVINSYELVSIVLRLLLTSVCSGIGFLGAGAILVTRNQQVRGLTTAAGQ